MFPRGSQGSPSDRAQAAASARARNDLVYYDPQAKVSHQSRLSGSTTTLVDATMRRGQETDDSEWLYVPVPVIEEQNHGENILVLMPDNRTVVTLRRRSVESVTLDAHEGVDDITSLSEFSEQAMLHTLRLRYMQDKIYTSVGPIVVSINPFKNIVGLYDPLLMEEYRRGRDTRPHIFFTAQTALASLLREGISQSIIISGDSGAGKTEAAKKILLFLVSSTSQASAATFEDFDAGSLNREGREVLLERLLRANVLLEAFGCAKTIHNDNSSRFGKFVQVQYNSSGKISGARVINYLLERTRIVQPPGAGERTYHILYELLACGEPALLEAMLLTNASPFSFRCLVPEGADPLDRSIVRPVRVEDISLAAVRRSLALLGLSAELQDGFFKLLASVLHMTSVRFQLVEGTDGTVGSMVEAQSLDSLRAAAGLLGLNLHPLRFALTTRVQTVRGERFDRPLAPADAENRRDAVAKHVYSCAFAWLVRRINESIASEDDASGGFIGLLDIYGFESLFVNGLEQLLINYANETLQRIFNATVFEFEQEQYLAEGIDFAAVTFSDNRPALELLEGGILTLLDDSWQAAGSDGDRKLLSQLHKRFATSNPHPNYAKPRIGASEGFVVVHYAGPVTYRAVGFCEKNREGLDDDLNAVILATSNDLLHLTAQAFEAAQDQSKGSWGRHGGASRSQDAKLHAASVAAHFKTSLRALVHTISNTKTLYVRCVKPNAQKAPLRLDAPSAMRQLRYSGMMEAVRIRRQGYGARLLHGAFLHRYGALSPSSGPSLSQLLAHLSKLFAMRPSDYQVGHTRVFLRQATHARLERFVRLRRRLAAAAIMRAYRSSRRHRAAKKIQSYLRMVVAKLQLRRIQRAARSVQAIARMWRAKVKLRRRRAALLKVQAVARGRGARRRYTALRDPYAAKSLSEILLDKEALEQQLAAAEVQGSSEDLDEAAELRRQLLKAADAAERARVDPQRNDLVRADLLIKRYAARAGLEDAEAARDFARCAVLQKKLHEVEVRLELAPSIALLRRAIEAKRAELGAIVEREGESADFTRLAELRRGLSEAERRCKKALSLRIHMGFHRRMQDASDPGEWLWLAQEVQDARAQLAEAEAARDFPRAARLQQELEAFGAKVDELDEVSEMRELMDVHRREAEQARRRGNYTAYGNSMLDADLREAQLEALDAWQLPAAAARTAMEGERLARRSKDPRGIAQRRESLLRSRETEDAALAKAVSEQHFEQCAKIQTRLRAIDEEIAALPTAASAAANVERLRGSLRQFMQTGDYERCAAVKADLEREETLLAALSAEGGAGAGGGGERGGGGGGGGPPPDPHPNPNPNPPQPPPSEAGTGASRLEEERKRSRKVARLRPADPVVCGVRASVLEVAQAMVSARQTAALLVDDEGALAGILTDKDVAGRVVGRYMDFGSTLAAEVMTPSPTFVNAEDTASDALDLMIRGKFRHLPVVDGDLGVTGVIDIAKVLYDALKRLELAEEEQALQAGERSSDEGRGSDASDAGADDMSQMLRAVKSAARRAERSGAQELQQLQRLLPMLIQLQGERSFERHIGSEESREPILRRLLPAGAPRPVVRHRDNVREACAKMAELRRAVLVEDDEGLLLGILTPTDVLRRVVARGLNPDVTAATSVMTENPDVATPDTTLADALHLMHDHRYLHLPVVSDLDRMAGAPPRALGCVDVVEIIHAAFYGDDAAPARASPAPSAASPPGGSTPLGGSTPRGSQPPSVFSAKDERPRRTSGASNRRQRPVLTPSSGSRPRTASAAGSERGRSPLLVPSAAGSQRGGGLEPDAGAFFGAMEMRSEASYDRWSRSVLSTGEGAFLYKVRSPGGKKLRIKASATDLTGVLAAVRRKVDDQLSRLGKQLVGLEYVDDDGDRVKLEGDADLAEAVRLANHMGQTSVHLELITAPATQTDMGEAPDALSVVDIGARLLNTTPTTFVAGAGAAVAGVAGVAYLLMNSRAGVPAPKVRFQRDYGGW